MLLKMPDRRRSNFTLLHMDINISLSKKEHDRMNAIPIFKDYLDIWKHCICKRDPLCFVCESQNFLGCGFDAKRDTLGSV